MWGVLVLGGSGMRGPAASTHIPGILLLPEPPTAAEIRKDLGQMGRGYTESWELAGDGSRFIFSVVLMDTIPLNLPVTHLRPQERARGSRPLRDLTAHHGRHPGPGRQRGTGTPGVGLNNLVLSQWTSAQINCFSVQF